MYKIIIFKAIRFFCWSCLPVCRMPVKCEHQCAIQEANVNGSNTCCTDGSSCSSYCTAINSFIALLTEYFFHTACLHVFNPHISASHPCLSLAVRSSCSLGRFKIFLYQPCLACCLTHRSTSHQENSKLSRWPIRL